jgi:hypothetical protein
MNLLDRRPGGRIFGRSQSEWRMESRRELGLSIERPIIATGHQTLLWHPGILAKYLVVDAMTKSHDLGTANLIVDQHAEGFGDFEIPIRRADGSLASRRIELCRPRPRKDVPMGRHESFTPPRPPDNLQAAVPSVSEGVARIFDAVYAHRDAPNAALQMAEALAELMKKWVTPMPHVTSTQLIGTTLAREMMRVMASDPLRCARCYNRAVASVPEAGIGPLLIRDDYVELPLWRVRLDGRRMHAYDNDVQALLDSTGSKSQKPAAPIDLLPRALFMTALVRLAMCDLFVHGTGGAIYDRAMELWMKDWLGIDVGSIAVATADLRLPLMSGQPRLLAVDGEHDPQTTPVKFVMWSRARNLWHDPEAPYRADASGPGPVKTAMLKEIAMLPRNSIERRAAFRTMHEALGRLREANPGVLEAHRNAELASRLDADLQIAQQRDWPFPVYPDAMIDDLAKAATKCLDRE